MFAESARLQLLKNTTEERDTMKAQAAIHVPKGETKRRAQITYLIAKVRDKQFHSIHRSLFLIGSTR